LRALWFRYVGRPLQGYAWPILGVLFVLGLVLGTLGFSAHPATRDGSLWDHLYRAMQLFTLQSTESSPPWQLELARWIALVVALGATVGALLAIFRDQVGWLRVRFARNHVLICGLGRCGTRLAVAFRDRGDTVVVIEKDPSAPGVAAARREGVVVVSGDATEPVILRRAGVRRARHLLALCGADGINVDVAVTAHELIETRARRPLDCFAHVVDRDVRRFINEWSIRTPKVDVFRLHAFDISELGAPGMLVEHPPFDEAGRTELGTPRLVVIGLGQTGTRLVLGAAQLWATTNATDARLPVTIVDRRADELVEGFVTRHPRLGAVLELTPIAADVDSPVFAERPGAAPAGTCVYVCLDDDLRGLRTALRFRRALHDPRVPIVVRTTERSTLATFPEGLESSQVNVRIFRMLDRACTPEVILQGTNEVIAQAIHEEYLRTETTRGSTSATNPSMVPWRDLPESLRESSRDLAANTGAKLRAIGCDIVSLAAFDSSPFVEFTREEIERLAELEHERWSRERIAAGWTPAPAKDTDRKQTPYLVPYADLPEDIREHDRNMVRGIPTFLAKAGYAIVRSGVDTTAGVSPTSPAVR
jgi:voltage-gated potassium channel Kch